MRRMRLRSGRCRRRCGVWGLLFFFFRHLPPPPPDLALFAPDCRCMAHRASPFLFFLPYWLYFPPRGGPLGEAPRSSCFWSVCSPRGRNGADSLIPDDLVFAFALFCLFFFSFLSLHTKGRLGGGNRTGGKHGMDGVDSFNPHGFWLWLCDTRSGTGGYIHIHNTLVLGFSFFVVGLFIVSSIGLNVVPCNLIRAALGPGEGGFGLF